MAKSLSESASRMWLIALNGAWRAVPPVWEPRSAELDQVAHQLIEVGAGALGWWRLNHSDLPANPAVERLRQDYLLNTIQAELHRLTIEHVAGVLHSARIDYLLVKGWAAARLYPAAGLRPYRDVDLCVRPEQFTATETLLKSVSDKQYALDLHKGFEKFGGGSFDEIYARSHSVRLGEIAVRVPSSEDHLRVLSIHLLREGAWRPMWLCDVAAAVESRSVSFDWGLCLGANRRWSDWVSCALQIAHQLLGADVRGTPGEKRKSLPPWLVPTILREWESPEPAMIQRHGSPMKSYLRHSSGVLGGLRNRWPNPIEATISARSLFNDLPRFPLQVGTCLWRGARFAWRLPQLLREQ